MKVTSRMIRAAEEALGTDVERQWLENAIAHHEDTSTRDLIDALKYEQKDFERKRGRDVDQAEYIDGLRAVIAIRKLPPDPKDWKPPCRRRKNGG